VLREDHVSGPPPVCSVSTLGLAAPSVGGLRPSVAGAGERFAVAWLELGGANPSDHEGIEVALLGSRGEAALVGVPADAASGWHQLSSPRLAASEAGFVLAFGGRDSADREGIAIAEIGDGKVGPPALAFSATGGPSALAVARLGARTLVGWSAWEVDSPTVNLTTLGPGAPEGPLVLDPAPHDPSLQLVVEGPVARAVWVGLAGDAAEPTEVVRGAILDGEHPPSRRFDGGPGRAPTLAPLDGDELLLTSHDGRLSLHRLSPAGARTPVAAATGHAGVVVAAPGGAMLCSAQASPRGDGDDIHCTRYHGPSRDEIEVASGAYGVQALAAATLGKTTALAWQQDAADGQGMVAIALVTCR
jgi:hypothetical protein